MFLLTSDFPLGSEAKYWLRMWAAHSLFSATRGYTFVSMPNIYLKLAIHTVASIESYISNFCHALRGDPDSRNPYKEAGGVAEVRTLLKLIG